MIFSSGSVIVFTSPSVIGGSSSSVEATHSRGLFLLCSKMSASQYSSFFLVYWCCCLSAPWRWSILFRAKIASLHESCLLHFLWYMDHTVLLIFSTPWPVNDLKGVSSLMNRGRWQVNIWKYGVTEAFPYPMTSPPSDKHNFIHSVACLELSNNKLVSVQA